MTRESERLARQASAMFDGELADAVRADIATDSGLESWGTLKLADRFYDGLGTGTLTGLPSVTWNGIDQFVFVPNPQLPFSYTTSAKLGSLVVTPQMMPTDGGTTPRILRGSQRYSSWGFAPAFIIHDWIFHANKLGRLAAPITFEESADVMAEIMKTLMESGYRDFGGTIRRLPKQEDTLYLMHIAVSSWIARRYWDDVTPGVNIEWGGGVPVV